MKISSRANPKKKTKRLKDFKFRFSIGLFSNGIMALKGLNIYAKKRHSRTILRRQSTTVNGDGVLGLFNQFPLPSGHCNVAQEKSSLFPEGRYDNRLEFQLLVYSHRVQSS